MQPRNFLCDLPIPFIDRMMSSMSSSMSLGQLFASFRFARDQTASSGLRSGVLGGKVLNMQTRMLAEQLFERLALVSTRVIQQDKHLTTEMPQQVAEE
jgi:hypothetical protein